MWEDEFEHDATTEGSYPAVGLTSDWTMSLFSRHWTRRTFLAPSLGAHSARPPASPLIPHASSFTTPAAYQNTPPARTPSIAEFGPQLLPSCPFPQDSDFSKAFGACKELEAKRLWSAPRGHPKHPSPEGTLSTFTPTCAGRVLGYGLLCSPCDEGRGALIREIIGCDGDEESLAGLAHLYVYGLIGTCTFSPMSHP